MFFSSERHAHAFPDAPGRSGTRGRFITRQAYDRTQDWSRCGAGPIDGNFLICSRGRSYPLRMQGGVQQQLTRGPHERTNAKIRGLATVGSAGIVLDVTRPRSTYGEWRERPSVCLGWARFLAAWTASMGEASGPCLMQSSSRRGGQPRRGRCKRRKFAKIASCAGGPHNRERKTSRTQWVYATYFEYHSEHMSRSVKPSAEAATLNRELGGLLD